MKLHLEKSVLIGFLITMVILAILGIFSFTSTQRLINTARLLSHTTRVINHAELVVKGIVDVETGQRGFVITGDEEFLEPYIESSKSLKNYLHSLDSLTNQNPEQHSRVVELTAYILHQLEWSKAVIEMRKESFEKAQQMVVSKKGKITTDIIRSIVRDIQREEREVFNSENTISRATLQQFQNSFIGLAVMITIIFLYLFYTINKNLKKRNEIEEKLRELAASSRDLYDHAPCGYFSVDANLVLSDINQTLLGWLGYSREQLIHKAKFVDLLSELSRKTFLSTFEQDFPRYKKDGYVNDLEFEFQRKNGTTFPVIVSSLLLFEKGEFAGSRTTVSNNTERKKAEERAKLLNQELEAFTYSVSHDLRAPLRSITGYGQILQEEYHTVLDDEGKRVIQIVINNAKRMSQLIDDLLDFSRLGRKALSFSQVNMEEMVRDVVRELSTLDNHRKIRIQIDELRPSNGDGSMLRQVWVNLISNALKYSRNRDMIKIEIKSYLENGQVCYSIRDNGTGFDMQYTDKLFGVFQRLHHAHEFEGTGVGLALVKTIVKRHGGFVWAEAKVDEGATFYFSLPMDEQVVTDALEFS